MSENEKPQTSSVQTTGHSWDGDIQEFNNPLPRWWLWTFYATFLFAIIYWIFKPAWPIAFLPEGFTTGIQKVTIETEEGVQKLDWNTRTAFMKEMQSSSSAVRQREKLEEVANTDYEQILADPELMAFADSIGKQLYGDNCQGCHGAGGAGVPGLFPNLADDDWLWGGTTAEIEQTLVHGRLGYMPAYYNNTFSSEQLDGLAEYVLSLSGQNEGLNAEHVALGGEIFTGETGGCYYCHTKEGVGLQSQGAANLTDAIWSVAKVPQATSLAEKKRRIKEVIVKGIYREMPAQGDRLRAEEIKMLTVYVHELGGGR